MQYTVGELKDAAIAKVQAEERLIEIGEGVGGLGLRHPDMFKDWSRWVDMSEDGHHADTVLGLIAEIERQRAINRRQNRYIDELEMGEMFDD